MCLQEGVRSGEEGGIVYRIQRERHSVYRKVLGVEGGRDRGREGGIVGEREGLSTVRWWKLRSVGKERGKEGREGGRREGGRERNRRRVERGRRE